MKLNARVVASRLLLIAVAFLAFSSVAIAARVKEIPIYTFQGQSDGDEPTSGLVADAAGNLYGMMVGGIYEVSPPTTPSGVWTETVLYSFQSSDGFGPSGGLIFDQVGNLYGTTSYGGGSTNCKGGCGTVFELSPPSQPGGLWTETVLYRFQGGISDGGGPLGGLVLDKSGNLYGTTVAGNTQCVSQYYAGCGTVFQLAPPSAPGGAWTETVLYMFKSGTDGASPYSGLVMDRAGSLYGTTYLGGQGSSCTFSAGCGTVFVLKPPSSSGGTWVERVIQRFWSTGSGGQGPRGTLAIHQGALYGTTFIDGFHEGSTVFEISTVNGVPTQTTLFTFNDNCDLSESGVVFDRAGNLYGTTTDAGCQGGRGFIFQLKPPAVPGGAWTQGGIYDFSGGSDGGDPSGGVIILNDTLYGATYQGGNENCNEPFGCGLVFSISH